LARLSPDSTASSSCTASICAMLLNVLASMTLTATTSPARRDQQ